jgi:hypothetical protein
MKKINKILIFLFIFLFIFYLFLFINSPVEAPNSPDESQLLFFLQNYEETGNLQWESELNNEFNTIYFRPRGTVEIEKNLYVPQISTYFVILNSTYSNFMPLKIFLFSMAFMGLLFFFLFTKELTNKKIGLISTGLFSMIPSYLFYSLTLSDLIPSILFLLSSLFLLLKFEKTKKINFLGLGLILFLLGVMIRIQNAIFFLIFVPTIFINYKYIFNKGNIQKFIILLIPLFLILTINKISYNSFLATGRSLIGSSSSEIGIINKLFNYGINPKTILLAFKNHILNYAPPLFLISLFGFITLLKNKLISNKGIIWAILGVSLFSLVYYGSNDTFYNFYTVGIQGSMARYFLPIYIFSMIFVSIFIFITKNKYLKIILIFILLISSILFSFADNDSFTRITNNKERGLEINEWANSQPLKSVFLVKTLDKYLVPDKEVMLIYEKEDLEIHPTLGSLYPLINPSEAIKIIYSLNNEGYTIYLTSSKNQIKKEIIKEGLILNRENNYFYKLEFPRNKENE